MTIDAELPAARSSRGVVFIIVALLSWHHLAPQNDWLILALFLTLPWAIHARCLPAIHLSVLAALMSLRPRLAPHLPFFFLTPLVLVLPYLVVATAIAPLRNSLAWLRKGSLGWRAWGLIAVVALISGSALLAWVRYVNPDLSRYAHFLPTSLSYFSAAVFAVIDALIAEIIYRGVMLEALDAVLGAGWLAVVLQSLPFGIAHYRSGFPNGWIGLGMTVFFGLMMGSVRRYTKGLLACWMAHAAVDFTILCLVIHFIRKSTGH